MCKRNIRQIPTVFPRDKLSIIGISQFHGQPNRFASRAGQVGNKKCGKEHAVGILFAILPKSLHTVRLEQFTNRLVVTYSKPWGSIRILQFYV